jgi:hypothetical protein
MSSRVNPPPETKVSHNESPFESFFKDIGEDLQKTYYDLNQEGTRELCKQVRGLLAIFMMWGPTGDSWVPRASRPYSLEEVQELCEMLLYLTPNVPAGHAESLQTLYSILNKAELRFRIIKKTVTIRTVYETRWGAQTTIKEATHYIDAQHTVQQAVLQEYPLPGVCKTVCISGPRFRYLWDRSEREKIFFRDTNLYFDFENGDTFVIALTAPEDELPPSGPAAAADSLVPATRCPGVTLRGMRACLARA